MNQGITQELIFELEDAHANFEYLISKLSNYESASFIQNVIAIEKRSYDISLDAINKMCDTSIKYNDLYINNIDFFEGEYKMVLKLIMLYIVSIIMIKIFSTTLSSEKLDEMWYGTVGMVLGAANTGLIYNNINHYRYDTKENRELMNEIKSLKEEYDNNFEIATREISYMLSLNRNLSKDNIKNSLMLKKIKGM